MEAKFRRTRSVRAIDERGIYHDVDFFSEGDAPDALDTAKTACASLRVNRQAAKQLDDDTYEIIATGLRLRRVFPEPRN